MPRSRRSIPPRARAFEALFEVPLLRAGCEPLQEPAAAGVAAALPAGAHLDRCALLRGVDGADAALDRRAHEAAARAGFPALLHDALGRAYRVEARVTLGAPDDAGAPC